MKAVSKSQLEARLLELLRTVEFKDEELIVTDRGKPVVKIVKYATAPLTDELFGSMRGRVKYFEELTTPTAEEWKEQTI